MHSKGRKLYHALKVCEKNQNFTEESGLGIQAQQVKPIWQEFERRVLGTWLQPVMIWHFCVLTQFDNISSIWKRTNKSSWFDIEKEYSAYLSYLRE